MKRVTTRIVYPALLVMLTACATKPAISPDDQNQLWQQHQRDVSQLTQWVLAARVAVRTGDKAWSGKLLWRQSDEDYRIQFNAPFGQGAFQLLGSEERAELRLSDGQVLLQPDAETLVYEQFGWRFPLYGLRYWVRGIPDPGRPSVLAFDGNGNLVKLQQQHWRIQYSDYMQVGDVSLPRKVSLVNSELTVRMAVDRWNLQTGSDTH